MSLKKLFCLVLGLFAIFSTTSRAAPILDIVGGELMGASNVNISGTYYDVEFVGGSCVARFNGCDSVSDFIFQSSSDAVAASQALFDQVFLDVAEGDFDTIPSLTNGCDVFVRCTVLTPYALTSITPSGVSINLVVSKGANNNRDLPDIIVDETVSIILTQPIGTPEYTWARWSLALSPPIPSTGVPAPPAITFVLLGAIMGLAKAKAMTRPRNL